MRLLVNETFLPMAYNALLMAERHIKIATFKAEITTRPRGRHLCRFFDTLALKAQSGLDVQFLINKSNPRGSIPISNLYAAQWLQQHKIKVRALPFDRCCHAKMITIDDKMALFGSHNLSVKSCHNNFEISYCTRSPELILDLITAFDNEWIHSK